MKKLLVSAFVILIMTSIGLACLSLMNKEWETLTATISLTIAIISGWIAFETFHRQSISEKPQIIIRLDTKSRKDLFLLVAENYGAKAAFNIKIKWNQELVNFKGEKITFNKYDDKVDIPVLNAKESTTVVVDETTSFYSKNKDKILDYNGIIEYQESINSKRRTASPFHISFKHYGLSPSIENEEQKAFFELQKIPERLEELQKELKKLTLSLNKKPST